MRLDPEIRRRTIEDILSIELRDNEDARELQADGAYLPPRRAEGEATFRAQHHFMAAATLRASPFDTFFSVVLPLARPGYLSAAVMGFAHTVGEFGVVAGGALRVEIV